MKKSIKKTVNYLKRYIGKEIIRTKPAPIPVAKGDVGTRTILFESSIEVPRYTKNSNISTTRTKGDYTPVSTPIILLEYSIGFPAYTKNPNISTTRLERDCSYIDKPIILTGFTKDGRIKYRKLNETIESIMSIKFTDRNWISFNKALKHKNNLPLSQWKGKKIVRTAPTIVGCRSFMDYTLTLKSVSKHHISGEYDNFEGKKELITLGYDYMDNNWKLAE